MSRPVSGRGSGTEEIDLAPPKTVYVDNPHAPDIFVSDISGLFMTGGNVAVTLERHRVNHGKPGSVRERVAAARLVLTAQAAQNLVLLLNTFLEQHGLSVTDAMKGAQTEQ